ncbi:MAG: PIN domain-containing protein [Hymenobacter sp.]|nr:MAG: PIN domain-containing protein [Hymenobacter sp.]
MQGTYILPLTADIARYAIEYRRIKGIKLPDAAILATARAAGADLLTENLKDFAGRGPDVRILSIRDL